MTMTDAVRIESVSHVYGAQKALDNISISIRPGEAVGLIGPDGVGKSTLFSLIAGARKIQSGEITVLGANMADGESRREVLPRIAFMPQGLGKNLYPELSIFENLDFFGRLFGQGKEERRRRIALLTKSTGLEAFVDRPAGKLSGGMKQKLGLCCALIHDPDILILDEPTTGVDPLSRRQFWTLIERLRGVRPTMSVLVSTAYMDEAEQFDRLIAIDDGQVLGEGSAAELKEQSGAASLEEAFVKLSHSQDDDAREPLVIPPIDLEAADIAIEARGLTKKFGDFIAVDKVSFQIRRGEIFGFLGPNGCGKTTTMRILTALLEATEGESFLLGERAKAGAIETRKRVGYMSQAFSLYTELTVRQNIELHGKLFDLSPEKVIERTDELIERFGLSEFETEKAEGLPLGVRQRLSLAVAIIHDPEVLILDEPTSGVDPVARDDFWRELARLSRENGVTIFVSTHFMNEAERCDRISFMDAGKVLATDTPKALMKAAGVDNLEDAFISILEKARGGLDVEELALDAASQGSALKKTGFLDRYINLQRLLAISHRETLELRRDTIRLMVAFIGTAVLMVIFGYAMRFDIEDLRFAVLDYDQTPESRTYIEGYSGSRYFLERPEIQNSEELLQRLRSSDIALAVEIPPNFGKNLLQGENPEAGVWIDGAMTLRARSIAGYVQGVHQSYLLDMSRRVYGETASLLPANIVQRYMYNQAFESTYAVVPAIIALLLAFIPSILTALGVVRERELGSITNFYVTPTSKLDFLLGKQLPYIGISMINFASLVAISILVFRVPLKGDIFGLSLSALAYVTCTTGIGMFVSALTRSQIAAIIGAAIITLTPTLHFSGLVQPVPSLEGVGRLIGEVWPTTYFLRACVGAFTKGLHFSSMVPFLLANVVAIPVILGVTYALISKQDR